MRLTISRNSKYNYEETIKRLMEGAEKYHFKITLSDRKDKAVLYLEDSFIDVIVENEPELLGVMPNTLVLYRESGNTLLRAADPKFLLQITRNEKVLEALSVFEKKYIEYINEALGVEKLKVEKIKLYSTRACPYCKMEDEWLNENNIKHETILVDTDQQAAKEMVDATGQMGVPVTEVTYDGGSKEYIVGFDKASLTSLLL